MAGTASPRELVVADAYVTPTPAVPDCANTAATVTIVRMGPVKRRDIDQSRIAVIIVGIRPPSSDRRTKQCARGKARKGTGSKTTATCVCAGWCQ